MSKSHVCIVTQSHLCRNPRVLKEAMLLANNGFKINIVTSSISTDLYRADLQLIASCPNIEIIIVSQLSFVGKLINKLARTLTRTINLQSYLSLGYGAYKYTAVCRRINADLYICHQELASYVGTRLINQGYKVAFDIEDWYSEDLLPEARKTRPEKLLKKVESVALTKGIFCMTTSNAMAIKLSEIYASPTPEVIYNVFPSKHDLLEQRKHYRKPLKLFWFSQTIGPGRGLEGFITLINNFQTTVELHLLGDISSTFRDYLDNLISTAHQLIFHPLVPEQRLAAKIAEFDIGLALELATPPSRNYTVTNKFFQYLQAGLPVIASATAGQKEVFVSFEPGYMLLQQLTDEEANLLEAWLNDPSALAVARERAIAAAKVYNWENESPKLLNLVKQALES